MRYRTKFSRRCSIGDCRFNLKIMNRRYGERDKCVTHMLTQMYSRTNVADFSHIISRQPLNEHVIQRETRGDAYVRNEPDSKRGNAASQRTYTVVSQICHTSFRIRWTIWSRLRFRFPIFSVSIISSTVESILPYISARKIFVPIFAEESVRKGLQGISARHSVHYIHKPYE